MQERTPAPTADALGDATLKPAATYVITPDTIDCTTFVTDHECQTSAVIRAPQSTEARLVRLGATLTTPAGHPVDAAVRVQCSDGCSEDQVDLKNRPAVSVQVRLTLDKSWRRRWPPAVASGVLGVVSASNRYEGTPKRLRILAPSPSGWQTIVIVLPAALALIVATAVARYLMSSGVRLADRMGAPSWRASESWSSNLTVGAGLTNGVLALAVISDLTIFMTKPGYGVVTMLLGALVVLAPIVYGLFRQAPATAASAVVPNIENRNLLLQPAPREQFEGVVIVFLAAGTLTLWASGGQLLTFALLIGELWSAAALSTPVAVLVDTLVAGVFVALFIYGATSMAKAPLKAKAARMRADAGREGLTPTRVPEWSLL